MPKRSKLSTTTNTGLLEPVSPGAMLIEEFLKPLGMSNYRLAKEIAEPAQRIGEIIAGRRSITADTDLRLCRFFGLSEGWWLRLQCRYDTDRARDAIGTQLAQIKPLTYEMYSDGRIREFEESDAIPNALERRVGAYVKAKRARKSTRGVRHRKG